MKHNRETMETLEKVKGVMAGFGPATAGKNDRWARAKLLADIKEIVGVKRGADEADLENNRAEASKKST
jgi:hypothetical protein